MLIELSYQSTCEIHPNDFHFYSKFVYALELAVN